jgi:uncharacterized membrane-anchored protein
MWLPDLVRAVVRKPSGSLREGARVHSPDRARVLVVTDRTAATPELLEAIRMRVARGPVHVRVLVPNPAPAEWHPRHPERHDKADDARRVLADALPPIEEVVGGSVGGFVSVRHDPMDAIEETLHDEPFDELIIATTPHHIEGWLHVDLPHRASHLGLPVMSVLPEGRFEEATPRHPRRPEGAWRGRRMLNKVPEVTLFFWIIKIMCTTVGETAADYLNANLGFGLTNTTYVTGALLILLLVVQFRLPRYVPGVYWAVVVVISVFGTLITDNLTDHFNVPLTTSTVVFAIVLAIVFGAWYASERTLSIHTIFTTRREAFYWLAILFTFALGTAAGDLSAEKFSLGYGPSILIFGGMIAAIAAAYFVFGLNAVLAFWLAYILTRPLGASIGDWMSQNNPKYGGLGLGTTGTSYIFLGCILVLVIYLSLTRRDATETRGAPASEPA